MTFKVAGAVLLLSLIAYHRVSYSFASREGQPNSGYRGISDELPRPDYFPSRVGPRAFISPFLTSALLMPSRNIVIRKSVSPNDFRLRYGKRSIPSTNLKDDTLPLFVHPRNLQLPCQQSSLPMQEEYD